MLTGWGVVLRVALAGGNAKTRGGRAVQCPVQVGLFARKREGGKFSKPPRAFFWKGKREGKKKGRGGKSRHLPPLIFL